MRLSKFKKGDILYNSLHFKTFEVLTDNGGVWRLRDSNTGKVSDWNADNNHGFSKINKGEQLNLL